MTSLGDLTVDARTLLRSLPALVGSPPPFDPDHAPDTPAELYMIWLRLAIAAGVKEPHAMVLSTVDAEGLPDARTLILKDVDESGWAFASSATSFERVRSGPVSPPPASRPWQNAQSCKKRA